MLLIKKLMHLRYNDGTPMTNHLSSFQGVVNKLISMGINFEEEVQALLLLGSLPESWETLKVTLCNSAPDRVVTWDLVKVKVLNKDARWSMEAPVAYAEVLEVDARGRGTHRDGGKKASTFGQSKSSDRTDGQC